MPGLIVSDVSINGIDWTSKVSGFPMLGSPDKNRIVRLGKASIGSGHDCCLKGIVVHHIITASVKFWIQWERYHFQDIVSSESTMHCITNPKFKLEERFNEYVDPAAISVMEKLLQDYKEDASTENKLKILYSCPMGINLKAGVITNYLQLKNVYAQRKTHTLLEWHKYCNWIKELPLMEEIIYA